MANPHTFVQAADAEGTTATPTLGSTPTEGNLLVLAACDRSGTAAANFTLTGWGSPVLTYENEIANGNARCTLVVWIKIAGPSETTTPASVSTTGGTNTVKAYIREYEPTTPVTGYSVPSGGTAVAGTGTGTTSPQNSGNTSSLAAADYVVVGVGAFRPGTDAINSVTWTPTVDDDDEVGLGGENLRTLAIGQYDDDTGGVYDMEAAWDSTDAEGIVACIVIEAEQGADTQEPTLSSPTAAATGSTTGSGSVSTDEDNGTLYFVVTTSSTGPSVAQVQAGQDHTGAAAVDSGSQAVSGTGVQNISGGFTGLTASTAYYAHYQHRDTATNDSTVATSASFTTDADSGFQSAWAIGSNVILYG